jgi:hypothetical protein
MKDEQIKHPGVNKQAMPAMKTDRSNLEQNGEICALVCMSSNWSFCFQEVEFLSVGGEFFVVCERFFGI